MDFYLPPFPPRIIDICLVVFSKLDGCHLVKCPASNEPNSNEKQIYKQKGKIRGKTTTTIIVDSLSLLLPEIRFPAARDMEYVASI